MAKSITKRNKNFIVAIASFSALTIVALGGFVWLKPERKKLYSVDYLKAVQKDENLILEKKLGQVVYNCQYIPAEYNAIRYLRPDMEKLRLKEAIDASNGFVYFKFSIKSTDPSNPVLDPSVLDAITYNERIQYFNAFAQNNLKLIYDKDTLDCNQYLFENPFNLSTEVKLMIAFKIKENHPIEGMQLIYNDELFNSGFVKFYFESRELQQIPELIIKS